jgi:hypothetical protein
MIEIELLLIVIIIAAIVIDHRVYQVLKGVLPKGFVRRH